MSADANSAFGEPLGGKRARQNHQDSWGDSPGSLPQNYQPAENYPAPSQPLDTSRGRTLTTSTSNAQVAPLATGSDWFKQRALAQSTFELWFQNVQTQVRSTFAD